MTLFNQDKIVKKYPVNQPRLSKNDIDAVTETLKEGWISSEGPSILQFERRFSSAIGRKYGIAVSNGTSAIDACVELCDLKENDEVIVPSFTIISTINAILRKGAKINFVDCKHDNYTCAEADIINKINKKTKLVICAHIYCYPENYANLERVCFENDIFLIEDAAELYGTTVNSRVVGTFGDASIVSFYINKFITTGEGGMILTDSPDLYERFKKIRNLSFNPEKRFVHEDIGYNHRMTNMQAALGLSQISILHENIEKKKAIGKWYHELLDPIDPLFIPGSTLSGVTNYYWVVPLHIPIESDIFSFARALANVGVGTRPQFFPLNLQPVIKKYNGVIIDNCHHAKRNYYSGLYLPNGLDLTQEDITEIVSRIKNVAKNASIIS